MQGSLQESWQKIIPLLSNGISLIPIRDKDEQHGVAKSPYGKTWKQYQSRIISEGELYKALEFYDTTAIGIVCGKVSGNLEVIDLDEKYMNGISARLMQDLQHLYPEIYIRLRIHGTPSKGFHLIYRYETSGPVEGNMKLAARYANDKELAAKPKTKTYCFLETRGEGGYIAAPPSLGYTVVQDLPIPTISIEDRNAIIALCKSYTYITQPTQAPYKPTQSDKAYYDTNPFEDFNNRCDPSQIMVDLGWAYLKDNSHFIWYTRPGKTKGISISFNKTSRFFYCFTSGTELEESHGYTPANLISTIKFNRDKKKTYAYLTSNGYGVMKPKIEEQLAKRAAINNKPLPKNMSPTGAALHAAISQQMQQAHPYGTFWYDDPEKGMIINREQLYTVADGLGFKVQNNNGIVQILGPVIYERDQRYFFDSLKQYISEEDADTALAIYNSYESFIERHGKFTISRLQILDDTNILNDTRTDSYKFYQNGMVHITAAGYELKPVPTDKIIWNKKIQNRNFLDHDSGLYVDFIDKAIGLTPYLLSCIGYLAHEYKDDTAGYIIVLSEQCANPKDGGGSGKNIFSGLLSRVTSFFSKAGSQVKYDEKFMQAWNFEKVFSISDVLKNFNFEFLKEFTTGSATMKKLHVNEYSVPVHLMPKFLISTNFSYEIKDGGIKRRVRAVEFTDFFTKAGGVDVYYGGKHFPNDWTEQDWGGYDTTMAMAIHQWLKQNRKLEMPVLTIGGWHKQFEQTYGRIINGIIEQFWEDWVQAGFISNDVFKNNCDQYYTDNNTMAKFRPSSYNFNEALAEYSKKMGYIFDKEATERGFGGTVRGRKITKN